MICAPAAFAKLCTVVDFPAPAGPDRTSSFYTSTPCFECKTNPPMMRKLFEPIRHLCDFPFMHRELRNGRHFVKFYNQPIFTMTTIPSTISKLGLCRSRFGDTDSRSSMASSVSTGCRFAHAEITDSAAWFDADFTLPEDARGFAAGFLVFCVVVVFFFRGLESWSSSSSSESTRRGITINEP